MSIKAIIAKIELTDTYGGEANYSWVKRKTLAFPEGASDLSIMRAVKAEMGLTGYKGEKLDFGDDWQFRPHGLLQIMFVTFDYEEFDKVTNLRGDIEFHKSNGALHGYIRHDGAGEYALFTWHDAGHGVMAYRDRLCLDWDEAVTKLYAWLAD